MSMWQPDQKDLKQVLDLLKLSMVPDTEAQKTVQKDFEVLGQNDEFSKYLMFVTAEMIGEDETIRSRACLNVKNIINRYDLSEDVMDYVKAKALNILSDQSSMVRKSSGILISTIVALKRSDSWPELFPTLLSLFDGTPDGCEGAILCLQKVCEDCDEMSKESTPMNHFVPKFIENLNHSNKKIRTASATCINTFIFHKNPAFRNNIDYFMSTLIQLSVDNDPEVCLQVCKSFVMLLEQKTEHIYPHMTTIVEFMIAKTQDDDTNISLEACEFWHCITEQQICTTALRPVLHKLIPVLVNNMKLQDMEIIILRGDEDDALIEDRDEDIKPKFYKGKGPKSDSDSDDEEEVLKDWNIRKSSAAALDAMAHVFKDELLPVMLPILKQTLFHNNWIVKESGVLALGAISVGCMAGISPHLHELIPYLINLTTDSKALVRVITCWTLSRYYDWIVGNPSTSYLDAIVVQLLQRMLDNNKKVQESACSALAKLEECAGMKLYNHIDLILTTFGHANSKYKRRNLTLLYDAIGTLASYTGSQLNTQERIENLMLPLLDRWNKTPDYSKDLFCLFECLSNIAGALKGGFLPYTETIFNRCVSLIQLTVNQQIEREKDPKNMDLPEPDFDLIECSQDLISGLIGAIQSQMEPLILNSNCVQLLYHCCQLGIVDVRKSSFSLLGDIARYCFTCLRPWIDYFMPITTQHINPAFMSVCNNSAWAIGEISIKLNHDELIPHLEGMMKQLLLTLHSGNRVLAEMSSIALARLGVVAPVEIGTVLDQFAKMWCLSVCNIKDKFEKETSFRGMCNVVIHNPAHIYKDLHYFCAAIVSWDDPGDNMIEIIRKILQSFRQQLGEENWSRLTDNFPDQLKHKLAVYT